MENLPTLSHKDSSKRKSIFGGNWVINNDIVWMMCWFYKGFNHMINSPVSWDYRPNSQLFCWVLLDFGGHRSPSCFGCWRYRWCSSFWLLLRMHLRVPGLLIMYLLAVEKMVVLVISDGVVLLVVQSDSCGVFGSSSILHGFNKVLAFVDNNFVGLGWIVLILKVKLVWR